MFEDLWGEHKVDSTGLPENVKERQNFWQKAEHTKLHSDLLQAWTREYLIGLGLIKLIKFQRPRYPSREGVGWL